MDIRQPYLKNKKLPAILQSLYWFKVIEQSYDTPFTFFSVKGDRIFLIKTGSSLSLYVKICSVNIFMPIRTRITPPKISALFLNSPPKNLPK